MTSRCNFKFYSWTRKTSWDCWSATPKKTSSNSYRVLSRISVNIQFHNQTNCEIHSLRRSCKSRNRHSLPSFSISWSRPISCTSIATSARTWSVASSRWSRLTTRSSESCTRGSTQDWPSRGLCKFYSEMTLGSEKAITSSISPCRASSSLRTLTL